MRRSLLSGVIVSAASVLLFLACSSDPAPSGGTSSSSGMGSSSTSGGTLPDSGGTSGAQPGSDAGSNGGTDDGGACHIIAQAATVIDQVASTAAAPAATGGAITDGTYALKTSKVHTAEFTDGMVLNPLGAITLSIQGGTMSVVFDDDPDTYRRAGMLAVDSAAKTFAFTPDAACNVGDNSGIYYGVFANTKYSADPTSLTLLVEVDASNTLENVYSKL